MANCLSSVADHVFHGVAVTIAEAGSVKAPTASPSRTVQAFHVIVGVGCRCCDGRGVGVGVGVGSPLPLRDDCCCCCRNKNDVRQSESERCSVEVEQMSWLLHAEL